jgi:hypothetical protein
MNPASWQILLLVQYWLHFHICSPHTPHAPTNHARVCICMHAMQPNNRTEARRDEEADYGSGGSPKSLLRGPGGPGICESDGSWRRALAAGGYNYMRIMQAAMGGSMAAAAPPEVVVEPRRGGAGIKRRQRADGERAPPPPPPSSSKAFTFLGFVVAPGPPPPPPQPVVACSSSSSSSRDHPFEVCTTQHTTALSVSSLDHRLRRRRAAWDPPSLLGDERKRVIRGGQTAWMDGSSSQGPRRSLLLLFLQCRVFVLARYCSARVFPPDRVPSPSC